MPSSRVKMALKIVHGVAGRGASRAATTPDGVGSVVDNIGTGGIASLKPRLIALNPPGSITMFALRADSFGN